MTHKVGAFRLIILSFVMHCVHTYCIALVSCVMLQQNLPMADELSKKKSEQHSVCLAPPPLLPTNTHTHTHTDTLLHRCYCSAERERKEGSDNEVEQLAAASDQI